MLNWLAGLARDLLGLERDITDVTAVQMVLRAVLVYATSLAIVRLGSKRFLSRATAFDVIVAIMLGSVLSRAINGSAPVLPSLAGGAAIVGLHWILTFLTARLESFGPLVKGNPVLLIRDGEVQRDGMRKAGLSDRDLEQHLRLSAGVTDPSRIRLACLERNGKISFIRADTDNT